MRRTQICEEDRAGQSAPVLVLGGSGRIGRLLARAWQGAAGYPDLLVRWQSRQSTDRAGWAQFDPLDDPEALMQAAGGCSAILVLAGVTPAPGRVAESFRANIDLALAAVAAADRVGVPRVLLCSSAAVYGVAATQEGALREDGPTAPTSDYGRAKLDMERQARRAARVAAVTSLRIGNVAGADQLLGPGRRDVMLDVFKDGQGPRRSYIGPGALARVLAQLLTHPGPLPGCLNLAAPGAVDMADLLRSAQIPFTSRPAPEALPARVELDVSRLATLVPLSGKDGTAVEIVRDWHEITGGQCL